jgi:hypothetical protein
MKTIPKKHITFIGLLVTSLWVLAPLCPAGQIGLNDFQISDMNDGGETKNSVKNSDVAVNSHNGDYLVVWCGDDIDGSVEDFEIYGQLLNASGNSIGENFRISDMSGNASQPAVTYNPTTREYLVVWVGDAGQIGVFGQRISASGQLRESNFPISDLGGQTHANWVHPDVTYSFGSERYMVVWSQDLGNENVIFGRLLNTAGQIVGEGDLQISDFESITPRIAHDDSEDRFLVVWSGTLDETIEVYGQLINSDGMEIGDNFRISQFGSENAFYPDLAYNSNEQGFLVVWHGEPVISGGNEIFGQLLKYNNGTLVLTGESDFQISEMGGPADLGDYDARHPSVTSNDEMNEYLVVWYGNYYINGLVKWKIEIFGQKIKAQDEGGSSDVFRLSEMADEKKAFFPEVVFNSKVNDYLIVWKGEEINETDAEIYGQRYISQERAPRIETISPRKGPLDGGTDVIIEAYDFNSDPSSLSILIGGVPATNVAILGQTELTATTPPGSAGSQDVILINSDSQQGILVDGFEYIPPPQVTSINPVNGPTEPGTSVTIVGSNFGLVPPFMTVMFGDNPATGVVVKSESELAAITPAGSDGIVDVIVKDSYGQSNTLENGFEYIGPPTITHLSPNFGDPNEETTVSIIGDNFEQQTTLAFGGPIIEVTFVSSSELTATLPAGPEGTSVDMKVTNPDHRSTTFPNAFTYILPLVAPSDVSWSQEDSSISKITFRWADNNVSETGYRILSALDENPLSPDLPPDTETWILTGLSPNTPQPIYVQVFNSFETQKSDALQDPIPHSDPIQPADVGIKEVVGNSVTLGWSKNGNSEGTLYQVKVFGDEAEAIFTTAENTYTVGNLKSGEKYYFQIWSVGRSGSPILFGGEVFTTIGGEKQIFEDGPTDTLDAVLIDPNPLRPLNGDGPMTLSRMPSHSQVRIYTKMGELVRDLTADSLGRARWDGRNSEGTPVGSGLYIIYVEGNGDQTVLKVAVLR